MNTVAAINIHDCKYMVCVEKQEGGKQLNHWLCSARVYLGTQPCVPKPDISLSERSVNVRISHPFYMKFSWILSERSEISSF